MKNKRYSQHGFTLVEMTIVILIGGILLSFLGTALLSFVEKNKVITTEHRMEVIKTALTQYLNVNRRYPCAAPRDQGPAAVLFGREVTADCASGAGSGVGTGTVRVASGGAFIRIGSVPTRTLNLPDEIGLDGWGRRFTYVVTERLATNLQYAADGGLIQIDDTNGNSVVVPDDTAHYLLISHGKTGEGSFTLDGTNYINCSGLSLDHRNCDDNAVFLSTIVNSEANPATFYDDYVFAKGQTDPAFLIPTNAVMAFDQPTCPPGWDVYAPAEGRFIAGVGPDSEVRVYNLGVVDVTGVPIIPSTVPTPGQDFTLGREVPADATQAKPTNRDLLPPFVALRYCVKQ